MATGETTWYGGACGQAVLPSPTPPIAGTRLTCRNRIRASDCHDVGGKCHLVQRARDDTSDCRGLEARRLRCWKKACWEGDGIRPRTRLATGIGMRSGKSGRAGTKSGALPWPSRNSPTGTKLPASFHRGPGIKGVHLHNWTNAATQKSSPCLNRAIKISTSLRQPPNGRRRRRQFSPLETEALTPCRRRRWCRAILGRHIATTGASGRVVWDKTVSLFPSGSGGQRALTQLDQRCVAVFDVINSSCGSLIRLHHDPVG